MSANAPVQAHVSHRFTASAERVFDAWTRPEVLAKWIANVEKEEKVVSVKTDARVGGAFSFVILRDGNELDHFGTYLQFDRPTCLVFTWSACLVSDDHSKADSSRVTIKIVPAGAGAELTLTHEIHPNWAHMADRAIASWKRMLGRIETAIDHDRDS